MTEGQIQGKCVLVRNNGEIEITELKLVGSNCNNFLKSKFEGSTVYFQGGACPLSL